MSLNRTTTWMAAFAGVFLLALPAPGQGLPGVQLFAPAETSPYGGGVRPKEGFFFSFDYLYWSTSAPEGEEIGFPGQRLAYYGPNDYDAVVQTNSLHTDILQQQWENGERFEIGDRWRHHGWMLGTLRLKSNSSNDIVANGVSMNWDDPIFGAPGAPSQQLLKGYYLVPRSTPQTWPSSVPVEDRIMVGPVDPDDADPTIVNLPIFGPFTDGPIGYVPVITDFGDEAQPAVLRPLPIVFDDVKVENKNELWGTELMYSYRTHPQNRGGFFEMYFGARYLEFNDLFSVDARNRIPGEPEDPVEDEDRVPYWTPGAGLADSYWSTNADNHIVGPQVALRWFRTSDRWTLDTSGRFVAGFNNQNIFQQGTLASQWYPGSKYTSDIEFEPADFQGRPLLMSKTSFTHREHEVEWSPIVELRINLQYQLTRGISVRGGWTGMWIDGIARGSSLNVYRVPDMGLDMADNRQDVFVHGFNFGAQLNY